MANKLSSRPPTVTRTMRMSAEADEALRYLASVTGKTIKGIIDELLVRAAASARRNLEGKDQPGGTGHDER